MSFLGNLLGDLPVIGHLVDTDAEKAAQGQADAARSAAEAYAAYRPEYQQNQQAALANMAGLLGPLNQLVQQNTGQSLDLGAGLAPAVSPEAMAVGPQVQSPGGQLAALEAAVTPWGQTPQTQGAPPPPPGNLVNPLAPPAPSFDLFGASPTGQGGR